MLRTVLRVILVFSAIPVSLIFNNIYQNHKNLQTLRKNEAEFHWSHIVQYQELKTAVKKLPEGYGVMLLNRHAVKMTLNWLCNTKSFVGVHQKMLFIVMDKYSEESLRKFYPRLNIVIWLAPVLQTTFRPYDSTYMSFFLMRTNMIHALQKLGKGFWMLQADTIWRDNFFNLIDIKDYESSDILLDQQGFEGTAEVRQRTMNGANFYVPTKTSSQELVDSWLSWQKSVYITDPDLVKIFCLRGDYLCDYIPYRQVNAFSMVQPSRFSLVAGWEWIYGDQKNPPVMIQMDGETGGNKEKVLEKYNFWFLDRLDRCKADKVARGVEQLEQGNVPRVISMSKNREQFYLKLGEIMNQIPVFGHYSSIYGGLTSLYLQFF